MVSISNRQAKHDHIWQEVERFYAAPRTDIPASTGSGDPWSGMSNERIALGVTTLALVCGCGAREFQPVLGQSLTVLP